MAADLYLESPDGEEEGSVTASVEAEYLPYRAATRDDLGEPEGYEVDSVDFEVNDDVLRCLDDGKLVVYVPGSKRAVIEVTDGELKAGVVRTSDFDLCQELGFYLLETQ